MKRVDRIFQYARDRMELGFDAFALRHPGRVLLYTLAIPKPGERPRSTKKVETGVATGEYPKVVRALRSEAFRTRIAVLSPKMDPLLIGRDENLELSLPDDENVSTKHAELTWTDTDLWVRDLGSKNGTLVNTTAVAASGVALHEGDSIHIGATAFTVLGPSGLYEALATLIDPRIAIPT